MTLSEGQPRSRAMSTATVFPRTYLIVTLDGVTISRLCTRRLVAFKPMHGSHCHGRPRATGDRNNPVMLKMIEAG